MLDLRPKAPKIGRRGKNAPPPQLPKPKPASLRSTKRTLAAQLGVRPDLSKEADKLDAQVQEKKRAEAPPNVRLPIPKAIQIMGPDPVRDFYLERGKTTKPEEVKPPTAVSTNDDTKEYADILAANNTIINQSLDGPPTQPGNPSTSLMDQLKSFGA